MPQLCSMYVSKIICYKYEYLNKIVNNYCWYIRSKSLYSYIMEDLLETCKSRIEHTKSSQTPEYIKNMEHF